MSNSTLIARTIGKAAMAMLATTLSASLARANDTIAVLGAGGISISNTQDIEMESEKLYISPSEVKVDYVFRNTAGRNVEAVVAFPMPDISSSGLEMEGIGNPASKNFMDFRISQDGKAIKPNLEQRAIVNRMDVTADLDAEGIPVFALGDKAVEAVQALPDDVKADWEIRGILTRDFANATTPEEAAYLPNWKIRHTYWWRTTFPADRAVEVHHAYKPSVGGISGLNFISDGKPGGDFDQYRQKYCVNDRFVKLVADRQKDAGEGVYYFERWLSYVLVTGANWAGPIGDFHLTIDKEDPDTLISFCGAGAEKTGPTTYEMHQENFVPERDLDILIVYKSDQSQ